MKEYDLTKEELMTYLYDVSALEIARQKTNEKIISRNAIIENNNAIFNNLRKPKEPIYETKAKARKNCIDEEYSFGYWMSVAFLALFFGVCAYLISFPLSWWVIKSLPRKLFAFAVAALIVLIAVIEWRIQVRGEKKNMHLRNAQKKLQYEREMEQYNATVRDYNRADAECHPVLRQEIEEYQKQGEQITEELTRLYGMDILHRKYRTPEAVLVMYNLLSTGRCDTLKEALNTYEDLLWKQQDAQWKVSISKQLSEICSLQRAILSSMDDLNYQMNRMSEISQQGFSELTAAAEDIKEVGYANEHHNEIIEGNVRTMALLQSIDFWDQRTGTN